MRAISTQDATDDQLCGSQPHEQLGLEEDHELECLDDEVDGGAETGQDEAHREVGG